MWVCNPPFYVRLVPLEGAVWQFVSPYPSLLHYSAASSRSVKVNVTSAVVSYCPAVLFSNRLQQLLPSLCCCFWGRAPPLASAKLSKHWVWFVLFLGLFQKTPVFFRQQSLKSTKLSIHHTFSPPPYSFGGRFCTSLWYEGEMLCSLTSF